MAFARVKHKVRRLLRRSPLNRFNVQTPSAAAKVLGDLALSTRSADRNEVLVLSDGSDFSRMLSDALTRADATLTTVPIANAASLTQERTRTTCCVVLGTLESKLQFAASMSLLKNPATSTIPLEYIALPALEHSPLLHFDRLHSQDFVSPLQSRFGNLAYQLFEESLKRFQHKTEIRDYLELCGLIRSVEDRGIPGHIAEFGSFRGHSGYLISRTLEEFGSDRHLYMFDMFEHFPEEEAGVDRFWSNTHKVDFQSVKAKFSERSNVSLVKGDFTQTLGETDTGPLSLAYIDCDSYRATLHVLNELWDSRLSTGGVVVLEDYGHAALLGNRLAAHEFFDERRDCYSYFSQFSGFFIAIKTSPSHP